jgi:hypothetical protein
MNEWITDRLPTRADADADGDVRVRYETGGAPEDGVYVHYSVVVPGQPWWSRNAAARAAQPTPPPAPAPTRVVTALAIDSEVTVIAACDDGTMWIRQPMDGWGQIPSIPQPEAPND